ncbi:uncharacterized protein [Elaeis guineensis]|uniref:uncharacterized protein isoform X2 n=1 Tax=Elaeis guineensis var. tenera TaxID=51953 RepID=UPI003C6CF965
MARVSQLFLLQKGIPPTSNIATCYFDDCLCIGNFICLRGSIVCFRGFIDIMEKSRKHIMEPLIDERSQAESNIPLRSQQQSLSQRQNESHF